MISLSERLYTVANMAAGGRIAADIGCDHAHVSIYLIENNLIERAIACDVKKGPLEKASENISSAGVSDRIDIRLSDGLSSLEKGEADTIIIAGMGGPLMSRIISEAVNKISEGTVMVLGPQSDVSEFRKNLISMGFGIIEEQLVFEDDKYYPIIKVIKGQECDYVSESDFAYGKILIDNKSQVLTDYLKRELNITKDLLSELNKAKTNDRITERIRTLEHVCDINLEAQKRMEV